MVIHQRVTDPLLFLAGVFLFDELLASCKHVYMAEEKKFRFWLPIDKIEKGVDKDGNEVMIVGGIASTARLDLDKQTLNPTPEGFDVSYLAERGVVNWNHSKNPEAIIGEPTKIEFKKGGLYVESMLYPDSELAKKVYQLGKIFKKHSKTRRLGYSIEGGVIKQDPLNPNNIAKARITGLALTVNPKNADSFVDIVKGEFSEYKDDDVEQATIVDINNLANGGSVKYLIDITKPDGTRIVVDNDYNLKVYKSMDAASPSGKAVTREHVDGDLKVTAGKEKRYLTKAEVADKIIERFGVISLQKLDTFFKSLNTIQMAKKQTAEQVTGVTEEMLEKALTSLNPTALNKAVEDEEEEEDEKPKDKKVEKGAKDEEEEDGDEDEDDDDDEEEKPAKKEKKVEKAVKEPKGKKLEKAVVSEEEPVQPAYDFAILEKGIADTNASVKEMFSNTAILLKGMNDKLNTVIKENSELKGQIVDLNKSLEETPNITRKSAATTTVKDRNFQQQPGEGNLQKGIGDEANTLSITQNKQQIVGVLDNMAFAKGFDPELAKALTTFESSSVMDPKIAARIKGERGITIVS